MVDIRVLIAEDQALMASALRLFVEGAEGLTVVGEAANGEVAITQCRALKPDVVLMDLQMPLLDGVAATRVIATAWPNIRVLALTSYATEELIVDALRAGACGYLVKDDPPAAFVAAIREVFEGTDVLSPQVVSTVVQSVRRAPDRASARKTMAGDFERLSERELEIVRALGRGQSNQEIARSLGLTEAAVKSHISRILTKLDLRDRVQVVIAAIGAGIVQVP